MPFVLDVESPLDRPAKRRKLLPLSMARYSVQRLYDEDDEPQAGDGGQLETYDGPPNGHGSEEKETTIRTSDREELIQCIKRGQRPTWVPRPGLEALCAKVNAEQRGTESEVSHAAGEPDMLKTDVRQQEHPSLASSPPTSATESLRRSLSALHTGDFYDEFDQTPSKSCQYPMSTRQNFRHESDARSPPWFHESPSNLNPPILPSAGSPLDILKRSRAPSLGSSLSSSFVMRVPTSPLVHATNNPSLDFSPRDPAPTETAKSARRRTLPPAAFESLHIPLAENETPNFRRPLPHSYSQRDATATAHRPRRSLSSFTYQPATSPQMPSWARSRRPSMASSEFSPRQRASMVGSFEESILRGRMSTPPSKPLDFVAQIGVVGKGNCPASLKCPAHVTVPFPAVFYSYPSSNESRSITDDNPSPYVGTIDLEHNLKPLEPLPRRARRSPNPDDSEALPAEITSPENTSVGRAFAREGRQRKERTGSSPKVPPGGAYRVPQKGQLQIIIKNPNKTAVKLFLVPYDLEDMPSGTKTFVRQRSFSSGSILETALAEHQASLTSRDPLSNKDILRYLIHLKFCSTGRGRFYLYDNVRVVFANRVPDDKERLRNDVQLPEPRFSPYRPPPPNRSRSSSLADEQGSPRFHTTGSPDFATLDHMVGLNIMHNRATRAQESPSPSVVSGVPISAQNTTIGLNSSQNDDGSSNVEPILSPISGFLPSTSSRSSPVPWPNSGGSSTGRGFPPIAVEAGDGLISRKLRELHDSSWGQED